MIQVRQDGQRYVALCSYEERAIPKSLGFRWDPSYKQWYTTDPAKAAKLGDPGAIAATQAALEAKAIAEGQAIAASRAAASDAILPIPDGLEYLPYQRAGIVAGLARPNVLFGDEMGLGKTIEGIGIINADGTIRKVLVVCPASLKLNWKRELQKFLVREMSILIVSGTSWPSGFDIAIINYDILTKHEARLREEYDLLIIDEAHYLKNPDAKRTLAVVGCDEKKKGKKPRAARPGIRARRKVALTGTPIPNRPIEGWTLFHYLAPETFRSFFGYAKTYCGAHQNGYGWDFSGASNLDRLQDELRSSIMIRRKKADVLTELPPKRRQVVPFEANGAAGAIQAEVDAYARHEEVLETLRVAVEMAKASDDPDDYKTAVNRLSDAARVAFTEMSRIRHDTAVAKIPYVVAHLQNALSEEGHKVVCFAWHVDVLDALKAEFPDAVMVRGDVSMQARQDAVDRFQQDPACTLFLGQIRAAGVGLTLTASAHVAFAELDLVPGNMTQAEDRCHRIGQKESLLVQHLVLDGSIDQRMVAELISKQRVIDAALDDDKPTLSEEPATPSRQNAATEGTSRDKLAAEAALLTPERIAEIHAGLQMLAAMDADRASELNGMGFNKMDSQIGHSLASRSTLTARQAALGAKLVHKYRRQLGGAK